MRLKSLELSGFRNLIPQKIEFDKRISFVYGRNGQGKTSLLEAIYLLSQQKSFREVKIKELISWADKQEEASVSAKVEVAGLVKKISYKIENARRSIFINDNKITEAKLFFGEIPVVAFTPENLSLVQGSPQERRKYLDKLLTLLDPEYIDNLVHYQRALKQRNALLKEGKNSSETKREIIFWDEILINNGEEIARKRLALLEEIKPLVVSFYCKLANQQDEISTERVSFSYQSHFLDEGKAIYQKEIIRELFSKSFEKDLRCQRTRLGIQADDFDLLLDSGFGEKKARKSASQGQARTFSLALILTAMEQVEQRTKKLPIILLDDVESELDRFRKEALEKLLLSKNNQIFITSTEANPRLKNTQNEVGFYQVLGGKISC